MVTEAELQDLMSTGLKTYFHDAFLSHEHIDTSLTQTAFCTKNVTQLLISTGVQQDSEARANYDREFFNPRYGTLRFKARVNEMSGLTMFMGFKSTLSAPWWGMTESCCGLFIDNANDPGVLYFYTGNGSAAAPNYQATPIVDIDMTRWLVYELEHNRFRWYNVPYTVPYFDKNVEAGLKQGMFRKWSSVQTNGSVLPDDTMHYIVFYVTNNTGATKYIDLQHVTYSEVYPD
jgi:hypothetical protein